MKLYSNPQSRAAIAKWMLDECGADYEIVLIDFAKDRDRTSTRDQISLRLLFDQRLYRH